MTAPLVAWLVVAIAGVCGGLLLRGAQRARVARRLVPRTGDDSRRMATASVTDSRMVASVRRTFAARRLPVRRAAQLPAALESIAAGLRAGRSLHTAIGDTARATAAPLGPELAAIAHRAARGKPIADALDAWVTAADDRDVRVAATALVVGARTGGAIARAADSAAATLRERQAAAAEVRALATQARLSAQILAVVPPAFTVLAASSDGRAAEFLLASPPGHACLVVGVGLELVGAWWMTRITRRVR